MTPKERKDCCTRVAFVGGAPGGVEGRPMMGRPASFLLAGVR